MRDRDYDAPRRHVPGCGPTDAEIMLVGEAPGASENHSGVPFSGPAGMELNRYLRSAGLQRSQVYVTNLCKYWPPKLPTGKQLPPTAADIERDQFELLSEIDLVRPRIIAAVGAHAFRWFVGPAPTFFVGHGIPLLPTNPLLSTDAVLIGCTHPAAGLHSDGEQVRIQADFLQLGRLARGQIPAHPPINRYPNPVYLRLTDADGGPQILADAIAGKTVLAIDTEGTTADPWCVTISFNLGEAFLIRADQPETLAVINRHIHAPGGVCTVVCHYLAHDIPVAAAMGIRLTKQHAVEQGVLTCRDTMSELYLLGTEPKGLKPAGFRHLGMHMSSYEDLVGPTEHRIAREYLERVFSATMCGRCWGRGKVQKTAKRNPEQLLKTEERCPDCVDGMFLPPAQEELVFDSTTGELRTKRPWSMSKKIKSLLESKAAVFADAASADWDDEDDDPDADEEPASAYFELRKRWSSPKRGISYRLREPVEQIVGPMPRTTLSDVPDQDAVTTYACDDSLATLLLSAETPKLLQPLGVIRPAGDPHPGIQEMDAAIIPMIARMEKVGMPVDRPHFEQVATRLEREMAELRAQLSQIAGRSMNPNSPAVADLLFRELGLPVVKMTKGKSRESVDDDVIGALKAYLKKREDPISVLALQTVVCIEDYKERSTLLTHFCLPLLEKSKADSRIHATIKYTGPSTGRLAGEDPNPMNIPNPDNSPIYGKLIKDGFVALPGYKLLSLDFSQIELVVGAHETQDRNLLRAFRNGEDLHYLVASKFNGIPVEQVTKAQRTQAKPVNFGAFYDRSAQGLMVDYAKLGLEITEAECQRFLDWYFTEFAPDVQVWKSKVRLAARIDGYAKTMFGRVRWMPGLRSEIPKVRAAAERECTNHPIQGGARDIFGIAMRNIWERSLPMLWAEGVDVECIVPVHDELLFHVPQDWTGLVAQVVEHEMRTAVELSVPIKVGVSVGDRWGSLEKMELV